MKRGIRRVIETHIRPSGWKTAGVSDAARISDETLPPEVWSSRLSWLGVFVSAVAVAFLVAHSIQEARPWHILGFGIYGFGVLSMFGASTLYHRYPRPGENRRALHLMDYCAVPLMIAGCFTPFCLIVLRTAFGLTVLAVMWAIGLVFIVLKISRPYIPKLVFVLLMLAMGWGGVILAYPLAMRLGWAAVGQMFVSGIVISTGTLIFNRKYLRPRAKGFGSHEVWHLFLFIGAMIHIHVLFRYVLHF